MVDENLEPEVVPEEKREPEVLENLEVEPPVELLDESPALPPAVPVPVETWRTA